MHPTSDATPIGQRYLDACEQIAACARASERPDDDVRLLCVSKTRTAEEVRAAYAAGARDFGENYLQDALPKLDRLASLEDIQWHFIGRVQSNKTRQIAGRFDWLHTLDRPRIARRLNEQREDDRPPLNVCLQVNLHHESQKAGCPAEALPDLIATIAELPRLRLRGLMVLPATSVDPAEAFASLRALHAQLSVTGAAGDYWDTLSMGMSGDYHAAIAAGSTVVRLGTAIFGPRTPAAGA
ncbi:MAG: YggS family pyridoxal phosphate-dependent enzyme [Pseudomonadota bacterium]